MFYNFKDVTSCYGILKSYVTNICRCHNHAGAQSYARTRDWCCVVSSTKVPDSADNVAEASQTIKANLSFIETVISRAIPNHSIKINPTSYIKRHWHGKNYL